LRPCRKCHLRHRTIAIIDAGADGTLESDLAAYRSAYGLPARDTGSGCLRLVNYVGGAQPAPQTGGEGTALEEDLAVETSLDRWRGRRPTRSWSRG
jgi:hypothetical protein